MNGFTEMEAAVLRSIIAELPEFAGQLRQQFDNATVMARENTGVGFFTTIKMSNDFVLGTEMSVIGRSTMARVPGLKHEMGFVLFMADDRFVVLEGYTSGDDSTVGLDLSGLSFEIIRRPMNRSSTPF